MASLTKEEQLYEIEEGSRHLKDLGISPSKTFSIPFGGLATFNQDTINILEDLGYSGYLMCSSSVKASAFDMRPEYAKSSLVALTRFLPGSTSSVL